MEEKTKNNIYEEHKKTLPKFLILGLIMSVCCYGLGIVLVDVLKMKYYLAGIIITPFAFTIRYLINKFWVFSEAK